MKIWHRIIITGSYEKWLSVLSYSSLLTVNRSVYSFHNIWSATSSSFNWFFIYSFIAFSFHPTLSIKYPLAQKFLLPYLYFKFPCLSCTLILQTVLHSNMAVYWLAYGYGLDMLALQWSQPFFFAQFSNDLYYTLHSLYMALLLYFGANIIWYWRLYLECAVLFIWFFM